MMPRTEQITLLQMDGEITKEELMQGIQYAKKVCKDINAVQRQALKEKYQNGGSDE